MNESASPVRVLVADDQELVRVGLTSLLELDPGITVVGRASDGREAVAMVASLRPDVCLFDIRMPGLDGIEATRAVAGPEVADPVPVIVITTFDSDEYVYDALEAGARGFLLKDAEPALLAQAVFAAARGDALIAPAITARLLSMFSATRGRAPAPLIEELTSRESEILDLVARGRTNAEIGEQLHLSLSTVKTHVGAVMDKLGARNRVEVALWAYQSGRLDEGASSTKDPTSH